MNNTVSDFRYGFDKIIPSGAYWVVTPKKISAPLLKARETLSYSSYSTANPVISAISSVHLQQCLLFHLLDLYGVGCPPAMEAAWSRLYRQCNPFPWVKYTNIYICRTTETLKQLTALLLVFLYLLIKPPQARRITVHLRGPHALRGGVKKQLPPPFDTSMSWNVSPCK